ncbi:hypothetical protein SUGI_0960870 [Cryptomeria japonica]|uniref:uncharacterized protein LOC131071525 n=1 Tax=Cryptomeria japonica TaxID=3369 RepID=UPI002414C465|nr:uncharacterized protein LOC131071525 [Cryptomeria japonica]GLJ45649.1 hypothetical protein SUGI_0960870 [Cryptomeria japonica]
MAADSESSLYEVPGSHVHNRREETSSSNGLEGLREQAAPIFYECKCQDLWLGRATVKRCFGCARLREAERFGKVKTEGLQSSQGAPGKHPMGIRVKEEKITQNIKLKAIRTPSMGGLGDMEIPRSSCNVKYPFRDVIVIEDDSDDGDNERGNDGETDTTSSNEDDDHDLTLDSDASSTKNLRSISCGSIGQSFNHNGHQVLKSSNHSEDEDDCQIFSSGRFRPFKRMKSAHRKNPSGNGRHVFESLSSDSDSAECEIIMEGSYGKLREEWEQAALKKQVLYGMEYRGPYVEEEFSVSGSNLYPYSPCREFEQEGKNEQANADFQKHHSDRYSTDPPDLVSASGIVYTSSQDDVTSHRTPKQPKTQIPRVDIFNGASIGQSANTVEVKPSREVNELGQNSGVVKMREVHLDLPHPKSQQVTDKTLKSSVAEAKSEFAVVENTSEWIADREKLKQTAAFRYAEQEEWTRRQLELQRQAEEAQRQRKRKRAEDARKQEMERRQKQRLEEMRETQKKDEETMDLKEKLRGKVRAQLEQVASQSKDMASLLRNLGIPVDGRACPSPQQVNAAYKQALLRFHPDHASNHGLDYQVKAEETFKLILRLKTTLLPVVPAYLNKTSW